MRVEFEEVTIGDCRLILGDCREVLPLLPSVDLVLTDPPYGIGAVRMRGSQKNGWVDYGGEWLDESRPEKICFDLIQQKGKTQIVWGGNYFTDYLPPTMQWLVWDKGQRNFSLADAEFAWSSQNKAARVFDYARAMAMRDGKRHPTQKPIALMVWCISQAGNPQTVLDPFMGSGTTGVACVQLGRKFTGIERERKYFDIAVRRIEQAYAQPRLFEDAKQWSGCTATQESLL